MRRKIKESETKIEISLNDNWAGKSNKNSEFNDDWRGKSKIKIEISEFPWMIIEEEKQNSTMREQEWNIYVLSLWQEVKNQKWNF